MADEVKTEPETTVEPAKPATETKPATPAATATPAAPALTAADVDKAITEAIKKHGDRDSAFRAVMLERDKYRDDLAATASKLPKDGAIVLDGDTKALWEAYQALGKPEDLTKALAEGAEAAKKATTYERRELHSKAADLHKYKPRVLTTLAERDGVDLVIGEVDGKDPKTQKAIKIEVAQVRGKDDKGAETLTPLPEYADRHWKDDLDWLRAEPAKPATPTLGTPAPSSGPPRPKVEPTFRRTSNALS